MPENLPAADHEARFNAMVEQYGKFLRDTVERLSPRRLGTDCDDIEQEARLRLWRALQTEREIADFSSYIYKIVVSATIDAVRRVKARREEHLNMSEAVGGSANRAPPAAGESPEDLAGRREVVEKVKEALARLAENRRRAVGLHLEGLTTQEIADLAGWSEAKARNLVYRGLKELREQLRTAGIEF